MKIRMFAVAAVAAALIVAPMAAYADDAPTEPVAAEEVAVAIEAPAVPETPVDVLPAADPVSSEPVSVPESPDPVAIEAATVVELASKGQPDMICDEAGFEAKVDTDGDPATVEVFAPAGKLIDAYCVKAGTTKHIIEVAPPAASVVIDHPEKDSVSHYQVRLVDAPPVEVTPRSCVGVGAWYTEGDDLAPVQGDEGLVFTGGTGKAVGIRVPVDGNLQGWTSVSFVNDGGQEQFFFRIVVDLSADGGPVYKSLSFPGYTTIDSASISYQFGESIAATAAAYPNNVIKSVGFQTNSGAPAGYTAVLKSVTGPCATLDFSDPLPEGYEVEGEWTAGEFDCDDTSYTETRVVTAYSYSRNEAGVIVETVTERTEERTVEREADCPVIPPVDEEPPAEEEPTPAPAPAAVTPDALAVTGSNLPLPIIGGGIIALLLAGAGAVAAGARRR